MVRNSCSNDRTDRITASQREKDVLKLLNILKMYLRQVEPACQAVAKQSGSSKSSYSLDGTLENAN